MLKGMKRYLRYSIIYVGLVVLIAVLSVLLKLLFDVNMGRGTSAVLPMIMGLMVGQWYFETDAPLPSPSERWGDAARFGALGLAISVIITAIALPFTVGLEAFAPVGGIGLLIILAFMIALFILATRLGIWLGVQTTLNAQKVKAGK